MSLDWRGKFGYGSPERISDHRVRVITSISDAESIHAQILESASKTVEALRSFEGEPLAVLKTLRFELKGFDPLTGKPLNLVEQLNQTFTILVTLRATERLIELHPEAGGFRLALGTSSGRDIESIRADLVAAEVFSATRPDSNQKLKSDLARLSIDRAEHPVCVLRCSRLQPRPLRTIGDRARYPGPCG